MNNTDVNNTKGEKSEQPTTSTSKVSQNLIDKVRIESDIVAVVSDYVTLKKSGRNFFGLCPFHAEESPSFSVNPSSQIFHCFGCGKGGNVLTFVQLQQGISFPEAVYFLANRIGIDVKKEDKYTYAIRNGAAYASCSDSMKQNNFSVLLNYWYKCKGEENPGTPAPRYDRKEYVQIVRKRLADGWTWSQLSAAVRNYWRVVKSPAHYYKHEGSITWFIGKGIDQFWEELNPWENFKDKYNDGAMNSKGIILDEDALPSLAKYLKRAHDEFIKAGFTDEQAFSIVSNYKWSQ